jgi:hypothetical protein
MEKSRVLARALGALVIIGTASVQAEEAAEGPAAPQCPTCMGWGKESCSACQGTRSVEVRCEGCGGSAREDCRSCTNGQKRCRHCGGKGYTVVYGAGLGGGVSQRPCSPTVPCSTCGGKSTIPCKKCQKGWIQVPCERCGQSGKQDCASCGGKGTVGVAEIPPPLPEFTSAEEIASFQARAQAALDALKAFAKSLEALRTRREEALEKDAALESKVEGLRKALRGDEALRNESAILDERWSDCRRARQSAAERLEEAEKEVLACSQAASALREMAHRLGQPSTAKYGDVAELPAIEATAERCRRAAAALESELDDQDRALKGCTKQLEESDAARRERAAKREGAARDKALLDAAYAKFKAAAEAAARKTGLPEIESVLLTSSSSARSLHAQVVYRDGAAPVAEDAEAVQPTDAALENLPRFISLVFTKVPEATRIQVTVEGRILGDTGHEENRPIQSFTMERKRWTELVTGQWKDDWRALLSKSKPAPDYPRVRSVLHEGWPLVLLLVVIAFSLGVLYVARSRMFQ